MNCYGCKCNRCANNQEVDIDYFTPGECDFFCYACEECKHYDGDMTKRSMRRENCDKFKQASLRNDVQRARDEVKVRKARKGFLVIYGGLFGKERK